MLAFRQPRGIAGRLGGVIMARANRRMARRAIDFLDVQPSDRVLEIGSGPGVGIQLLADSTSAGWVAGVDHSEEMLAQARARNVAAIDSGRVALQRGSVQRLPFKSATFDRAVVIKSMQVWPDIPAGLREVRRVLRPGGGITLAVTYHSRQTTGTLKELLATAGFTNPQVMHLDGEFYALASTPAAGDHSC